MDKMRSNPAHITDFPNGIQMYGYDYIVRESGEPSFLPDFAGQIYISTTQGIAYIGTDHSGLQWILIGGTPV